MLWFMEVILLRPALVFGPSFNTTPIFVLEAKGTLTTEPTTT